MIGILSATTPAIRQASPRPWAGWASTRGLVETGRGNRRLRRLDLPRGRRGPIGHGAIFMPAGLVDALRDFRKPFLGLCLGMQLLFDFSEEGNVDCLGIVRGRVKRLPEGVIETAHGLEPARHGPVRLFCPQLLLRARTILALVTMTARHGARLLRRRAAAELLRRPMAPRKIGRDRRPAPPPSRPWCLPSPSGRGSGGLPRLPREAVRYSPRLPGEAGTALPAFREKAVWYSLPSGEGKGGLFPSDVRRTRAFGDDPLEIAENYRRAGAQRLHLVNSRRRGDGRGDAVSWNLVARLSPNIEVQVGGGIRDCGPCAACRGRRAPPRW